MQQLSDTATGLFLSKLQMHHVVSCITNHKKFTLHPWHCLTKTTFSVTVHVYALVMLPQT